MRISDWSSDVCSSDLAIVGGDACLVHVEGALHLDLQGVTALGRPAVYANDLGALVRIVHRYAVVQRAEAFADEGGEGGIAALAVGFADHHVRGVGARAVGGGGSDDRLPGTRVAVGSVR